MKLYYRSNVLVKKTSLKFSRISRDFGAGFYLTTDYNQASDWANKKVITLESGTPYVSKFEYYENNELKVKKFNEPSIEWFDYVVLNRTSKNINNNYDIVIGPIANDSTYEVLNLYIRGVITKENAISKLKKFKLKDQYAFKTDASLNLLTFVGESK